MLTNKFISHAYANNHDLSCVVSNFVSLLALKLTDLLWIFKTWTKMNGLYRFLKHGNVFSPSKFWNVTNLAAITAKFYLYLKNLPNQTYFHLNKITLLVKSL